MRTKTGVNRLLILLVVFFSSFNVFGSEKSESRPQAPKAWRNPKIRPWQDYPFVEEPENTLHAELWEDFDEIPQALQRGRLIYVYFRQLKGWRLRTPEHWQEFKKSLREFKARGASIVHSSRYSGETAKCIKDSVILPVCRIDGKHFFGLWHMKRIAAIRKYHSGFPPAHDWFRKFPPSLAANAVMRDGQLAFEYYGSNRSQRRTTNYMHPVTIQMRDALIRESVLGEQVFDIPFKGDFGGQIQGVWFDNPNNQVPSFDPYSFAYTEKKFRKDFGDRYPEQKHGLWYSDPPHFAIKHKDREVMRWWIRLWAGAHAGYYAWQYKFLQEEIAPRIGMKHMFTGGNYKLATPRAAWNFYAFSWPIADVLGPCESPMVYTDKHASGYKLALAASNGKPAGLWINHKRPESVKERLAVESIACLGASCGMPPHLMKFQHINMDLFHNAKPGAQIACLYHLEDGLFHNEIANMCRLTDQMWNAGVPYEAITERHLSPSLLKRFKLILLPGFRFSQRDLKGLKTYLEQGGNLLLVGDNRGPDGKPLVSVLAGKDPLQNSELTVGKGRIKYLASQLITQAQMNESIEALDGGSGYRILEPSGRNVVINVISQSERKITSVHLVNLTGGPVKNMALRLPAELKAGHVALISPYGGERSLPVKNDTVVIPQLSLYSILVICPDAQTRNAVVARNAAMKWRPLSDYPPKPVLRGNILKMETKLEDLKPGEKLCHLRQTGRCNMHRLDADVVTRGQGKVGKPQDITLKILAIGVHGSAAVHLDKLEWVIVDLEKGSRETVAVKMVRNEDENEKEATIPAATFVRRITKTSWTPKRPGKYQLYLSYRYVNEAYEGKPDYRGMQRGNNFNEYFWSVPMLKMVYEDRLPGMVVDVKD